jgi:hypothetical protein
VRARRRRVRGRVAVPVTLRGALAGAAGLAMATLAGAPAVASEPVELVKTAIICEQPAAPGRFHCDVEVRARDGRLAWADVEVGSLPDFILPLRGRLGPRDASIHEPGVYRWSVGFVARARQTGDLALLVRAVVCQGADCVPVTSSVSAEVAVDR